jgi:hypothetical protein
MKDAVAGCVIEQTTDRKGTVWMPLVGLGLEQVHQHDVRARFECRQKRERILHVFDDVEGIRKVKASWHRRIHVVDGRVDTPPLEPPT